MVDSGFNGPVTVDQMQAILGNQTPVAEAVSPTPGAAGAASRTDHTHPRLTSTTVQTLGAGGNVTVNFTRTFATMPGVVCTAYKVTDNLPVSFEVASWIMSNGAYAGCVIHGDKSRTLPAVLTLLTALISFNTNLGDATGTQFSCVAIQASN